MKNINKCVFNISNMLSDTQIEDILDFIKPQGGIPEDTAKSIAEKQKQGLRKQLKKIKVHPDDIPELKEEIKRYHYTSLITPGESVGMIAAQSFGEANTQNTLNTFHKAGDTDKTVVVGVARFEELLSVAKNPKGKCCSVYFKGGNSSIQELRNTIGNSMVEMSIEKLALSIKEYMNKEPEEWYELYKIMYDDDFAQHKHCISLKMNLQLLYEYSMTLEDICNIIKEKYMHNDLYYVFSPDSIGQIDIFVDVSNIKIDEEVLYVNNENKEFLYLRETVKPLVKQMHICGIPGIKQIYYLRDKSREGEWMVETDGSNFPVIMAHPMVDTTRTISNDPLDIIETLDIEAAGNTIYNEFLTLMPKINTCHAKLLSDKMTYTGSITSINRYAMRKDESGPLGKASFEETLENFVNAAIYGEHESTKGVSASIICGKRAQKMGTGLPTLHMDMKSLLENTSVTVDVENDDIPVPEKFEKPKIDPSITKAIKVAGKKPRRLKARMEAATK